VSGAYMGVMASHHHHDEHSGPGLVEAARHALTGAGEQWTEMRAEVFHALAAQDRPASAYDALDALRAANSAN